MSAENSSLSFLVPWLRAQVQYIYDEGALAPGIGPGRYSFDTHGGATSATQYDSMRSSRQTGDYLSLTFPYLESDKPLQILFSFDWSDPSQEPEIEFTNEPYLWDQIDMDFVHKAQPWDGANQSSLSNLVRQIIKQHKIAIMEQCVVLSKRMDQRSLYQLSQEFGKSFEQKTADGKLVQHPGIRFDVVAIKNADQKLPHVKVEMAIKNEQMQHFGPLKVAKEDDTSDSAENIRRLERILEDQAVLPDQIVTFTLVNMGHGGASDVKIQLSPYLTAIITAVMDEENYDDYQKYLMRLRVDSEQPRMQLYRFICDLYFAMDHLLMNCFYGLKNKYQCICSMMAFFEQNPLVNFYTAKPEIQGLSTMYVMNALVERLKDALPRAGSFQDD